MGISGAPEMEGFSALEEFCVVRGSQGTLETSPGGSWSLEASPLSSRAGRDLWFRAHPLLREAEAGEEQGPPGSQSPGLLLAPVPALSASPSSIRPHPHPREFWHLTSQSVR